MTGSRGACLTQITPNMSLLLTHLQNTATMLQLASRNATDQKIWQRRQGEEAGHAAEKQAGHGHLSEGRAARSDRRRGVLPPKGRGAAGARMSSLSRSFMSGLLAGDSAGGGENSNASVGPPECNCCSSSHLDTHRNTSLHTFCMTQQSQ